MATGIPATQLAERIQHLLEQRQEHADAIAQIDETLAGVGAALGSPVATPAHRNGNKAAAKAPATTAAPAEKKRRGSRGGFAMSAEESILTFIRQHRNPTTSEINQHFKGEGRKSSADNALGRMVIENKLNRLPLGEGIRGSRYVIA